MIIFAFVLIVMYIFIILILAPSLAEGKNFFEKQFFLPNNLTSPRLTIVMVLSYYYYNKFN